MAGQAYLAGNYGYAIQVADAFLQKAPDNPFHGVRMGAYLREIQVMAFDPAIRRGIMCCLKHPMAENQPIFRAWLGTLWMDPDYAALFALEDKPDYASFLRALDWTDVGPCLRSDFLIKGLRSLIIMDVEAELLFTRLRRVFAEGLRDGTVPNPSGFLPFLCALAENAFQQEYVMAETDEETSYIEELRPVVENGNATSEAVALYGCYRPLHALINADTLASEAEDPALRSLMEVQVFAPRTEKELRQGIPIFGTIADKTSAAVREMYEENPYPHWRSSDISPVLYTPVEGTMLVAGCGTGWHTTQIAMAFPNLQIQAVDLSLSSLAYARRKAREYGANNISFAQCDILDLGKLEKKFDFIECSGVLHHMKDPAAGWAQLAERMNPGGRMLLGLYSRIARQAVHEARDAIREKNYPATANGIRAFRQDIFALPEEAPLRALLDRQDFYSLSECRDLVFHVQEHTYTIPELAEIMDSLGLTFLGFRLKSPQMERLYAKFYPDDPGMRDLERWAAFEEQNPDFFVGMYQFVCCRKGEEDSSSSGYELLTQSNFFRVAGT